MSKYDPTVNPGDTRVRVWRVDGENPLNGAPSMRFHEEQVVLLADGEKAIGRTRTCHMGYLPDDIVVMRNPIDDTETGTTMTQAECFAVLYSLGRHAQLEDDDDG